MSMLNDCMIVPLRYAMKGGNAPPSNGASNDTDAKWTDTFDDALKTCDSAREVAEAVGEISVVLHVSRTE